MSVHFETVDWSLGATIYEVNLRQYTHEGSFNAFAQHLPRLKDMGVDILWFMPITPISFEGRQGSLGSYYACSSYVKTNPEFGTIEQFKSLVNAAHSLGMKVIIDWVANHTGQDHEWIEAHPDFYTRDAQGRLTERNGWKDIVDLNYYSVPMRKTMIEAMQFWINECNIDGFRCDMAHLVPLDFWKEARKACDSLKPLYWLAECEEMAYHDVFDTTYAWWWMHETEKFTKGERSIQDVHQVLHAYSQYPKGCNKLFFTANHDENSWNGTEYEKYGAAAKNWAIFTSLWERGMPLLYSGQELPNHKRLAFFDKDVIEWSNTCHLHTFYKALFQLHKKAVIQKGETFILPTDNQQVLAFLRKAGKEVILCMLNFGGSDRIKITVNHPWLKGKFQSFTSGMEYSFTNEETFELGAYGSIVYIK